MKALATKTRKQLEAIISKADTRIYELVCDYNAEIKWLFVRRGKSYRMMPLKERFATNEFGTMPDNLSEVVERLGVEVYEENTESNSPKYIACTKRAIKRLRTLEKRISEWEKKSLDAEDALDAGEYVD